MNRLWESQDPVYQSLVDRLANIYYSHYPDTDRYRHNPYQIAETGVRSLLANDKAGLQPFFANSDMLSLLDRLADAYRDKPKHQSLNSLFNMINRER